MAKYITTRKFVGKVVLPEGSVIELTDAQAQHPLYRNRVRKHDGEVQLEVATPEASVPRRGRPPKDTEATE